MEKIGYKIYDYYDSHVELLELTIVGDAHHNVPASYISSGIRRGHLGDLTVKWPCISKKAIWSTNPNNFGINSTGFGWEADVFFSLDGVEQKIQDRINLSKKRAKDKLDMLKVVCKALDEVDLQTLPKDPYISPLTGKTN